MVTVLEQWGLWGVQGLGHCLTFVGWVPCAVWQELLE